MVIKKTITLILLVSSPAAFTNEISPVTTISGCSLLVRKSLGNLSVLHDRDGFKVEQDNKKYDVQRCLTDTALRDKSSKQVAAFLKANGKLSVKKIGGKEFKLSAYTPGLGGGPVAGTIAYWTTKALCYGTAAAAATTAVVATGGAAGAVSGALVAGAASGATAGTSVVAGAIAGAGFSSEALLLTTSVVTNAGGVGAAIATVESAAMGAGTFFLALPFLP